MLNVRSKILTKEILNNFTLRLIIGLILWLTLVVFMTNKVFAASFSLNPEIVSTQAGQEFSIDVLIDTQKKPIDGADVVLTYNSEKLEVVKIDGGESFPNYPIKSTDSGLVKI